jgi:hypothetical protein
MQNQRDRLLSRDSLERHHVSYESQDLALERGRLCVVIATIVINVIAVSLLTFVPWSNWRLFALLARTLRQDSWRVAIVAGAAGGASIFVCYAVAFLITDRLIS